MNVISDRLSPYTLVEGLFNLTNCDVLSRAFHFYRKTKEPVKKQPELERLLAEEFRTMDDFRKAKEKFAKEAKDNQVKEGSNTHKDLESQPLPSQQLPLGGT